VLVDGASKAQRLFFDGHLSEAERLVDGDHTNDGAIVHSWIQLWKQVRPLKSDLLTGPDWRRLILGGDVALREDDESLLEGTFPLQRQREIAAFFRALIARQARRPLCVVIPSSDEWSIGRKLLIESHFKPPAERSKGFLGRPSALQQFRFPLALPTCQPELCRRLRIYVALVLRLRGRLLRQRLEKSFTSTTMAISVHFPGGVRTKKGPRR